MQSVYAVVSGETNDPNDVLLPKPKRVKWLSGSFTISADIELTLSPVAGKTAISTARLFAEDLAAAGFKAQVASSDTGANNKIIKMTAGRRRGTAADKYTLTVNDDGVSICGAGESGLFYGTRTFLQLLKIDGSSIPFCHIEDFNRRFCKSFFGLNDTKPIEYYEMISDGFFGIVGDAFGDQWNRQHIAYGGGLDDLADEYGDKVNQELLDQAVKQQDRANKLLESMKKDCVRNRQALDFLDMPPFARVSAVRRILYYKQARELIESAKSDAAKASKTAEAKLSQAEDLLTQIDTDLQYLDKRFKEAVKRFGSSILDIERVAEKRKRIAERKAEAAKLKKEAVSSSLPSTLMTLR
ncbi:MAG: glycoside hydrolase family 20 zincin-like fold domain-containing protein [Armatimonadota bacterium]|nr:glycoside hydrolase family 20 zincin-like fold domain-containing protein [Armatimonadota bacterium]